MGCSAEYLTEEEWMRLQQAHRSHGRGVEFWQVYQELQLVTTARAGDSQICAANEMARIAERIGATEEALLV
jgi:hypothetical protein